MEKLRKLKKIKGKRKHGFLVKMGSHKGRLVLKKRRQKGRKKLAL